MMGIFTGLTNKREKMLIDDKKNNFKFLSIEKKAILELILPSTWIINTKSLNINRDLLVKLCLNKYRKNDYANKKTGKPIRFISFLLSSFRYMYLINLVAIAVLVNALFSMRH